MVACRPPYDCPPRSTLSGAMRRIAATAHRNPSRSLTAVPGDGGPVGRLCRKGRSHRSTCKPRPLNAFAAATNSGALQLPPAPCVSTIPSPPDVAGRCRNPRTPFSRKGTTAGRSLGISVLSPLSCRPRFKNHPRAPPCLCVGASGLELHKHVPGLLQLL